MPPTDEARAQRARILERADAIEARVSELTSAQLATDRTARKARRTVRWVVAVVIAALLVMNIRTILDERNLRATQERARHNTCATDALWLRLIARQPPPKTPEAAAQTEQFRAQFQAESDANHCPKVTV